MYILIYQSDIVHSVYDEEDVMWVCGIAHALSIQFDCYSFVVWIEPNEKPMIVDLYYKGK